MSNAVPPTIKLPSADGKRVATFFWQEDRYAHTIEKLEVGATLTSIEGAEEFQRQDCFADSFAGVSTDWPCSPPLQQLSLEDINGKPVVMGVGLAGSSHWSISGEQTDSGFRFDVAARCKATAS